MFCIIRNPEDWSLTYTWPAIQALLVTSYESQHCRVDKIMSDLCYINVGKPLHPPLTPIPVAEPFDRVGVDVIRFPPSQRGNKYAVVFVDYLTKWPEVFPAIDQSALTIARLLVEKVVTCHGVPTQLLSDRGTSFLSNLIKEVCNLLGIKKVNTTAYHPQTDGLVERFNHTLTDMLSKKVKKGGKDNCLLFCLRIEPVYKNPLERVLSCCCMDIHLEYLRMLNCNHLWREV